jgi:radical SAM protein with 4Fe4S-binding SPASM domain
MKCQEPEWPDTKEYLEDFAARIDKLRIPFSGSLELTHRCNLNCVHCYLGPQDSRQSHKGREIGTGRMLSLLDEITEAGCLNLLITGGEPLLREDFTVIYRHARENGLLVTVFTNGTTVTDNILQLFRDLPPVEVEISIYGATAATYERITGVTGSYERCLRGIKSLLQNGTRMRLKTVLMTLNSDELYDMENIAKELDVRFRFDAAISPCLNGDVGPLSLRVPPEEAIEKEMADPMRVERWGTFFAKFKDATLGDNLYGCNAGISAFHLDPFGRLLPCMMTMDIGCDISETPFMTGWENILKKIRDRQAGTDFACRGCKKINFCGYCPAFFRLENGREDICSEYLCQMGDLRLQYIYKHISKGEHNGQQKRSGQFAAV